MKYIYFFLFFLVSYSFALHPDPFIAIGSKIPVIKNNAELYTILTNNSDSIVIVISYVTHVFNESESHFYQMPRIYEDLFAKCKGSKKMLFYRMHATKACPQVLSRKLPAMNIFFEGERVFSVGGSKSKKALFDNLMSTARKHLKESTRVYGEEIDFNRLEEIIFGGDDGN